MKTQLGIIVGLSALMIGPAMAQQPNPNQVAAKALLQAADKAMGASFLKSWTASGTGWIQSLSWRFEASRGLMGLAWPCGFTFQPELPLTNSLKLTSPWTGKPAPPPRGLLFP